MNLEKKMRRTVSDVDGSIQDFLLTDLIFTYMFPLMWRKVIYLWKMNPPFLYCTSGYPHCSCVSQLLCVEVCATRT